MVDAIQKHIDAFSTSNESFYGNTILPILFFLVVFGFIIIMPAIISSILAERLIKILYRRKQKEGDTQTFGSLIVFPLYLIIGLFSLIYGTNFLSEVKKTWFSDTKIFPQTANSLELYATEITFLSLVVSFLSIILTIYFHYTKNIPDGNLARNPLVGSKEEVSGNPKQEKIKE